MDELAGADSQLAEALAAMHRAGRAAWPAVELSTDDLARYVAALAGAQPIASWLSGRPAADLYLACGCSALHPAALAAFDDHVLSQVESFLTSMRPDRVFVDEVRQVLREKLFVGAAPKIAEYSGRGSLLGWLRVVTVRTALNLRRRRTEMLDGAAGGGAGAERGPGLDPPIDPELDYLKDHYRAAFRAAIEASFAVLSSEQRNLLRLHFLEGMTLHQLATLFQVHRGTVARWIAQTRRDVLEGTRAVLQRHLVLETAELDSMMRLLDSRLEVSMRRLLQPAPG
jgi:RNA polymerase sigma-70 factor, ECF subfamily